MSIKITGLDTSTGSIATASDGNTVVVDGNINLGDDSGDDITIGGEIKSSIVPDADNTYDLGSASKKWRNGYFDQINAKQRDIKLSKYTENGSNQRFIRFNTTGVAGNTFCGQNSILVAPADGALLSLIIRCKSVAGNTDIIFHKASDGFALPSNSSDNVMPTIETETINIDTANKSFVVNFTSSTFTVGQILAVSVNPTNAPDDVNITTVWLFDWNA